MSKPTEQQPLSKLDEQRQNGYTAWDKGLNAVEVPPPALIGTFAASEAPAAAAASAAGGPSAWNAAGVFEERDLFGWAKSELQTRALSLTSTVGGVTVRVTSVSDVSGTATIIFSRGKKRAGFDLEFKLEYEGTPGGKSVKGSMSVSEANSDDLDDLTLKDAGKDPKDAAVAKAAQGLAGPLRKLLEELLKDLSAK